MNKIIVFIIFCISGCSTINNAFNSVMKAGGGSSAVRDAGSAGVGAKRGTKVYDDAYCEDSKEYRTFLTICASNGGLIEDCREAAKELKCLNESNE